MVGDWRVVWWVRGLESFEAGSKPRSGVGCRMLRQPPLTSSSTPPSHLWPIAHHSPANDPCIEAAHAAQPNPLIHPLPSVHPPA